MLQVLDQATTCTLEVAPQFRTKEARHPGHGLKDSKSFRRQVDPTPLSLAGLFLEIGHSVGTGPAVFFTSGRHIGPPLRAARGTGHGGPSLEALPGDDAAVRPGHRGPSWAGPGVWARGDSPSATAEISVYAWGFASCNTQGCGGNVEGGRGGGGGGGLRLQAPSLGKS